VVVAVVAVEEVVVEVQVVVVASEKCFKFDY